MARGAIIAASAGAGALLLAMNIANWRSPYSAQLQVVGGVTSFALGTALYLMGRSEERRVNPTGVVTAGHPGTAIGGVTAGLGLLDAGIGGARMITQRATAWP